MSKVDRCFLVLAVLNLMLLTYVVIGTPEPVPVFQKGNTTLPYRRAPEIRPERKVWT